MRILIVEDELLIADGLKAAMELEGYAADTLGDGEQALQALQNEHFDLMILDVGLPGIDGFEVLAKIRQLKHQNDTIPVLMLTARDTVEDRIAGLNYGADDYLIKPFDIDELLARVRALLRRSKGRADSIIEYKKLIINTTAHSVHYKNNQVELLPKEFSVLLTLLESQGKVVSKTRLEESIYAWDHEVGSNALEVHIHHIRKKLFSDLIKTIRGIGYLIP